jgi:hypothetical protein
VNLFKPWRSLLLFVSVPVSVASASLAGCGAPPGDAGDPAAEPTSSEADLEADRRRDAGAADAAPAPLHCSTAHPSLSKNVQPILARSCSAAECHRVSFASAQSTHDFLVNGPALECSDGGVLVLPGDPEHSYVIDKLTDRNLCAGEPMPRAIGAWKSLPKKDLQTIYDWICRGAPND